MQISYLTTAGKYKTSLIQVFALSPMQNLMGHEYCHILIKNSYASCTHLHYSLDVDTWLGALPKMDCDK